MILRGALLGLVCWAVSASLQASTPEPHGQSAQRELWSSLALELSRPPALQPSSHSAKRELSSSLALELSSPPAHKPSGHSAKREPSSPQPPKALWRLPSEAITLGPWTFSGLYGATFNQTFLRQWNAGGQNSLNTGFILRQSADYARDKWSATHLLDAAYGLNFQEGIVRKMDDKLEYNLRVDHLISGQPLWKLSGFGSLKSQWYKGFAKPDDPDTAYVSRFLAPGYALAGLGLTHKDDFVEFYFSPVTAKYTVVLDPRLQAQGLFGLSPGQALRQEMGAYMNMRFKRNFPNKLAVDLRTNLFGNYLATPFSIDVDADILLVYKATNYLSITLRTQGIFDRDIAVRDSNGDGKVDAPGIQLKQLSGVGLTYNFGSIK